MRVLVALIFLCFNVLPALAVNPDEVLSDPALEARARALSVNLRCLVCQNQSIDDSDAELAKDLRVLVRERLLAGDSDEAAIDYIVARYGEYVLLKPRLGAHTIVLWLSPFVLLFIGIASLIIWQRRRPQMAGEALSTEEETALEDILKDR